MLPQETKSTPGNSQPSFTSAPKIPVSLGTPVMQTPVAPVPKKAAENTLTHPEDPKSKQSVPQVSKKTELPAQLPKQVPTTDLQKKIEPVIKSNPTAQKTPPIIPTINDQIEAQKESKVPSQNQANQSTPEDAIDDLMNSNITGPSILKDKPKSNNSIFDTDSLSNAETPPPNAKRPKLTNAANTALTSNFTSTPHNQPKNNDTSFLISGYQDDSSILKKDRYKRKPRTDNILNKVPTFNPQDDVDVSKLLSKYNFE